MQTLYKKKQSLFQEVAKNGLTPYCKNWNKSLCIRK